MLTGVSGYLQNLVLELKSMKLEARQVAILRNPKTGDVVGKLYLWETGEADPMWFNDVVAEAIVDPLPSEDPDWANWTLDRHFDPKS